MRAMLLFFSAFATRMAMATPPDTDALAAWFAGACTTPAISVLPDIDPVTLDQPVKTPTMALAIQLSSTAMYLEGRSTAMAQLPDALQEHVDRARMLEQASTDSSFRFNARLLLILSGDAPGDALLQILDLADRIGFETVEFYFRTAQTAPIPELLNAADVAELLAELAPLGPTERQQRMVARITPLVDACAELQPVFGAISMASLHSRCEIMIRGFPSALKACNDPALSQKLYMHLYQMVSPMDQPAATTVTLSLQPDGQPLQVAEGDTWQTLHEQVVSRDGGTLRAGAQ